jgi:hypothetical protein
MMKRRMKAENSAGKVFVSSVRCRYTWVVIGHARFVVGQIAKWFGGVERMSFNA